MTQLTRRSKRLQDFLSATAARLVRDGVIDLAVMKQEGIARPELLEALRILGVNHLGEVERVNLEPSGKLAPSSTLLITWEPDCPCRRRVLTVSSAPTVRERPC